MLNIAMLTLSSLLLLLLLLCGVHCYESATESPLTFEYRDPSTGKTLACNKCPPGTYLSAHCTAATQTQCAPCRGGHFTELWNYLPKCLYCNKFCTGDKEVETECGPRNNRVCRCKEGYYMTEDYCNKHTECAHGYGVLTRGTSQNDTVCQMCSDGFFSASSSAMESCAKHKECVNGQLVLLNGSAAHDTMCGLCEDVANGGERLRTFLSRFFGMHRIRLGKMIRFFNRYIAKSGLESRPIHFSLTQHQRRPHLLHLIRKWLQKAPKKELEILPRMLRACRLTSMAEKLYKRLKVIEGQQPNCTLTHLFSFD
ncbi:tumor necrosis factor receptor superfamily member 6B-like [Hippocampus comes]|uniref:tumor necrosis factor receptor superfamily member 6B-like n=1 Tax=Hippocampus comes TaxID=109280 RepID=UPI00094F0533|nr:PREDICTED: tumor necrosis factor receptor superfamily member 6B-like [Hippocampus comes]